MRAHFLLPAIVALLFWAPVPLSAAIWIVDDTGDPVPVSGGSLTLRQAINNSEANSVADTILFQLPAGVVHTILPVTPLPQLTKGFLFIDGFSQPGASPGPQPPTTATIMIEIDGSVAGAAHGLWILSSCNQIQGLAVMNFQQDGIRIEGTPAHTQGNVIYANFIGTDAAGMNAAGNGWAYQPGAPIWAGVDILCPPGEGLFCHDNLVSENLVADNTRIGVEISSCPPSDCYGNTVALNFVGTDVTGMLGLPNHGTGISLAEGTHHNHIDDNVVSANEGDGIDLNGLVISPYTGNPVYTHTNFIEYNIIGLTMDGRTVLGNAGYGVSFGIYDRNSPWGYANNNEAKNNTIAHNGLAGVCVWEDPSSPANADGNRIQYNSIYANGGLGIDLADDGVTLNDYLDADSGPNEELNFPQITGANWFAATLTVSGTVDGGIREIDVYRASPDPSGHGEGSLLLGSTWSDAGGNWSILVLHTPASWVTATATDGANNTSEFSALAPVPGALGVDYGDAPDPPYPTLLASNGARHTIWDPIWLDHQADAEADGQPDPSALGDDNGDANDDEKGISFLTALSPGAPASVQVKANFYGFLDAWIDFQADGSWAEPGDAVFVSQILQSAPSPDTLTFNVPATATSGQLSFARFRFSTQGGLSYAGPADDGEVEDYVVYIGAVSSTISDAIPPRLVLQQNVPNPFNPSTRILFHLPASGPVLLTVYSLDGRRVATLMDERLAAGPHAVVWDGRDSKGRPVASGTYCCRLQALGQERAIRITLIK